jgi:hypothetical protein
MNLRVGFSHALVAMILACTLLVLVGGCSSGPDLCCSQYERASDRHMYCNNHSSVAGRCLNDARFQSQAEYILLRDQLEEYLAAADTCDDVTCIETILEDDEDLECLWNRYDMEHSDAEESLESQLSEDLKARLILCGFRNAIQAMESGGLHQEGE